MGYQKQSKLSRLHQCLPEGLVADTEWFGRMGYPGALRSRYVKSGWLESVVRGVFRRPLHVPGLDGVVSPLDWGQVLVSLQSVMGFPVAVGGRTALDLHGHVHYLQPHGPVAVHIYGEAGAPSWLGKLPLAQRFTVRNSGRLFRSGAIAGLVAERESWHGANGRGHAGEGEGGLTWGAFGVADWPIIASSPERAMLEMIDELPNRESFNQVDMLMDGFVWINVKRMNELLRECRSVKVKRLFLWFAERHGHQWLKGIERGRIDLGKGRRMLGWGGKVDPTYLISVPEEAYPDEVSLP